MWGTQVHLKVRKMPLSCISESRLCHDDIIMTSRDHAHLISHFVFGKCSKFQVLTCMGSYISKSTSWRRHYDNEVKMTSGHHVQSIPHIVLSKCAWFQVLTLTRSCISKNSRFRHDDVIMTSHDYAQSITYIVFGKCAKFCIKSNGKYVFFRLLLVSGLSRLCLWLVSLTNMPLESHRNKSPDFIYLMGPYSAGPS